MGCRLQTCRWLAPQWFDSTFRAFFFSPFNSILCSKYKFVFCLPVHFCAANIFCEVKHKSVLTRVLCLSLPVLLLVSLPTASVPVLVRVAGEQRERRERKGKGEMEQKRRREEEEQKKRREWSLACDTL